MKFAVRVKYCYSQYIMIKEKAPWGQIKMLLETDFCYRRIRWSGSPLYVKRKNGRTRERKMARNKREEIKKCSKTRTETEILT